MRDVVNENLFRVARHESAILRCALCAVEGVVGVRRRSCPDLVRLNESASCRRSRKLTGVELSKLLITRAAFDFAKNQRRTGIWVL